MRGERGFALIITLIITALLIAVTTEFIHDVFVETSLLHGYKDAQQASLLAESGVQGGVKVLQLALSAQDYTSLQDGWAAPQVFQDERGSLQISISEESSKLDINSIVYPNGTLNEAYYGIAVRLLDRLGLPTRPVLIPLPTGSIPMIRPGQVALKAHFIKHCRTLILPKTLRWKPMKNCGWFRGSMIRSSGSLIPM